MWIVLARQWVSHGEVITFNLDLNSVSLSEGRLQRARAHRTEAAAARAAGHARRTQATGDSPVTDGSPPETP